MGRRIFSPERSRPPRKPSRATSRSSPTAAAGPEGADWNSPVTVTLENANSSITYDLGEAREISAIVAQADANDTYKVMGSADGSPASFKLIVELANVVNTGHGLRTRATQVTPTTVRYLRIGDANGDTYFSMSEFQAYCKAPTPFPPGMKIVDAPPAAAPIRRRRPSPGRTPAAGRCC